MNVSLTAEQIKAIDNGEAVVLLVEGRDCVLLPSSRYNRMQEHIDRWYPSTTRRSMAELMADDWSDPAMSIYDES